VEEKSSTPKLVSPTPETDMASTPPLLEPRQGQSHYWTPTKAAVREVVKICDSKSLPVFKEDVFRHFGVERTSGYKMLRDISPRRKNGPEKRGRKPAISPEKMKEIDIILWTEGIAGRALTWEQLGTEVGLDVSGRTIQETMKTMN
jgi:hypothetical protein